MTNLNACPLCENANFSEYLLCKDYTVSHETFQIQRCEHCDLLFTNPRPADENLSNYYASENYISHTETSAGFINSLYRLARTFTLRWKYRLIQEHSLVKPASILDFGCGTGAFLQTCQRKNISIAGVEPAPNARAIASRNLGVKITDDLAAEKNTYDAITLWHVLEHVTDLNTTIANLYERLEKNGTMFIAVPNHQSRDARKYKEHWAAYDVPRHLWHFTRKTMTFLLKNHSLNVKEVLPMPLDAYYVSLLSEKYRRQKTTTPAMIQAFVTAVRSNHEAKRSKEYSSLIYVVRK